jgi:hypothetical protein
MLNGTAEFDPNAVGRAPKLDNIVFYKQLEPLAKKSDDAGVPQYREIDMIKIWVGERDFVCQPVEERHKQLYPQQWAAFCSGKDQPLEGTPLSECPIIPRTIAESLTHLQLRTVEQLVDCPDGRYKKVPEADQYRAKCKRWLEVAKKQAETTKIMKENEEMKIQIEMLRQEMEKMSKKYDEAIKK